MNYVLFLSFEILQRGLISFLCDSKFIFHSVDQCRIFSMHHIWHRKNIRPWSIEANIDLKREKGTSVPEVCIFCFWLKVNKGV